MSTDARSSEPLRVLHLESGKIYGGIETVLVSYANEARRSSGVLDFAFGLCFQGRLADELRATGAPVTHLGDARIRDPLAVLRARKNLAELLRAARFDVVLIHSTWAHVLFGSVVRKAGLPLAFYMHAPWKMDSGLDFLAARVAPDYVLHNSAFTQSAARLFTDVAGCVVYYPVPQEVPSFGDRAAFRASCGAGPDDVVILQASRLEEWKGQRLHIEALARIQSERPWRAWFAGGHQRGAEERTLDELQALATSLGIADRVRFLGQRSDVPALMAAADIFCQPNTGPEPFGVVFIEAMRAKLPVVATALGGPLETVDATCGLLPVADAGEVARALTTLIDDDALRARLGAAGPERARLLTAPETQMRALEDALRRVAARGRGRWAGR